MEYYIYVVMMEYTHLSTSMYNSTKKSIEFTKDNTNIEAYWSTCKDSFNTEQYLKITNKKGCVLNLDGDTISVYVRTDDNKFEKVDDYINTKGYIIPRIKQKKWKEIQFKFVSNVPFSIYDFTIQSYIGSFVKR